MQNTAQILDGGSDQFILLPEWCRIDTNSVWIALDNATGIITVNPKLSATGEVSEAQRQRDIQAMTKMIAAKANNASTDLHGPAA
jgi:hypothetical protein